MCIVKEFVQLELQIFSRGLKISEDIATDSLTSMHQIKRQLSHPNLYHHHIQGDVLQSIVKAIHQSPSPIHSHKIKSHAGIIGNAYADALARKSNTTYSDVADTSIRTASWP
jgi:ribonuclease HI